MGKHPGKLPLLWGLTLGVALAPAVRPAAADGLAPAAEPLVQRLPAGEGIAAAPAAQRVAADPVFEQPTLETTILPSYAPILVEPGDLFSADPWRWQVLPEGLVYRSYLAGVKEPRFATVWNHDRSLGWIWDISLGGRVGMLRLGTEDPLWPEGWQIDVEGAAMLRLDPEVDRDLVSSDYRFGIPLTFGRGHFRTKFGYYHLSSHLGDEYILRHPGALRDNYVHDSLVLGESFYPTENLRLYAEAAWAFYTSGRAKPWEFQFGLEFSPAVVNGIRGAPFFAIGGHLREELDYGGNLVVQTGWQWRGRAGQLARLGMQYYAGASDQYQFTHQYEDKIGVGLWYDY